MSNKAMQARVRPLQGYDSESFIVMLIDFDSSSKFCFEETSNSVIGDKNFKKVVSWFLQVQLGFCGQMLCHAIPTKSAENFIIWAKISKGKVEFSVALSQWKCVKT